LKVFICMQASFSTLLAHLSIESLLHVFAALLLERKLIFCSRHLRYFAIACSIMCCLRFANIYAWILQTVMHLWLEFFLIIGPLYMLCNFIYWLLDDDRLLYIVIIIIV